MAVVEMDRLVKILGGAVRVDGDRILVEREDDLPQRMDALVREAVFGGAEAKAAARWLIREIARVVGVRPASIHEFYLARGRGDVGRIFTVPAINLRMLAYDSARAVFRAARKIDAGAFIFEIARSEIGYTDQRPAEYAAAVLAAALREGFRGPVFLQGDHFQASAKKYAADPGAEVRTIRELILEAVEAGFLNIDIDTSTLVDLSFPTLEEQQRRNYELCAEFTAFIRDHEPSGTTITVGGEIGEVGQKNSTVEDLDAFMRGYEKMRGDRTGIAKISIQTGTSHGGVVLPDGTLAQVAIDFEALRALGERARTAYGLGGAVQHGASTLPESAFHKFVEAATCEVHLATAFQNRIMDHRVVPAGLRDEMHAWLKDHASEERKPKDTEAQFLYKTRKKTVGPFKRHFWSLPEDDRDAIGADLEKQFAFLFDQLKIAETTGLVAKHVQTPDLPRPLPAGGQEAVKGENVDGLAD